MKDFCQHVQIFVLSAISPAGIASLCAMLALAAVLVAHRRRERRSRSSTGAGGSEADPPDPPQIKRKEGSMEIPARARARVWVVDDNTNVARHIALILGDDYAVTLFHDTDRASERLHSGMIPDIILCEIALPGAGGIRLCKAVRSGSLTRHIPFLFIGTEMKAELRVEGLEAGADAYLGKPFSPAYLRAQIRSLLRNRLLARGELSGLPEILGLDPSTMDAGDRLFLSGLEKILQHELDNPELSVSMLASKMSISRSKLFYRTKEVSGMSPNELVRCYRLEIAARLLREGRSNVSEAAYSVGISSLSYFSKAFKKQFGILPRDALRK